MMVDERSEFGHRLDGIDGRLGAIETVCRTSDGRLAQLVAFEERRDRREDALLKIEKERRDASAEERAAITKAELAERAAKGAWRRSLVTRDMLIPLISAISGIIATLATIGGVSALQGPAAAAPPAIEQEAP